MSVRLVLSVAVLVGCNFPGIRPEGLTQSISAYAPANRDEVYQRARIWFDRNGYVVHHERAGVNVAAHQVIDRTDGVETRAIVEFEITRSSETETSYTASSRTERGGRLVESNAPRPPNIDALVSWLSCPTARWPRCP